MSENNRLDIKLYREEIAKAAGTKVLPWEKLRGKTLAISGGSGMIGSFLVDVLLYRNETAGQDARIFVLGRSEEKAKKRFSAYADRQDFCFVKQDIHEPISTLGFPSRIDYVIHAASNTHPVAYANDPIGTISANVFGTRHLLDFAKRLSCERFLFLSSVEIYGENRGDTEKFSEESLGYIDCNTLRAGYPESKRTGEALCQAYRAQENMDVVIARLSRVYGATLLPTDTKALSQFLQKSVKREDIVLKSEGTQKFSYCHVADAVVGILKVLLDGVCGEAYNVASKDSDVTLRELAEYLAKLAEKKVVFELPEDREQAGYSKATKAMLDTEKIEKLGYRSMYDIKTGLAETVSILRELAGVE